MCTLLAALKHLPRNCWGRSKSANVLQPLQTDISHTCHFSINKSSYCKKRLYVKPFFYSLCFRLLSWSSNPMQQSTAPSSLLRCQEYFNNASAPSSRSLCYICWPKMYSLPSPLLDFLKSEKKAYGRAQLYQELLRATEAQNRFWKLSYPRSLLLQDYVVQRSDLVSNQSELVSVPYTRVSSWFEASQVVSQIYECHGHIIKRPRFDYGLHIPHHEQSKHYRK